MSLSQDGADEVDAEGSPAGQNQGLREGLLQEERPADPLGYRSGDGLPAGISAQVAQPVHTGKDEAVGRGSTSETPVCPSRYWLKFIP